MTMYVVAGDGEMPKEDLKASLDDLETQAVNEERQFWMLVRASAEPTATDRALMAWVKEHETYYETYGPDAAKPDEIYKGSQEKHPVKGVANKLVELLNEKPEDGEDAMFLALFASDDPEAPEDAELYTIIEAVLSAGFPVYALNDGLAPITLTGDESEGDDEDAETVEEDAEEPELTREYLESLPAEEVKEVATQFGITFPPRTRTSTYITAILERGVEEQDPEVEVEEIEVDEAAAEEEPVAATNGHLTDDPFAVVKSILRSLGEALIAASK